MSCNSYYRFIIMAMYYNNKNVQHMYNITLLYSV